MDNSAATRKRNLARPLFSLLVLAGLGALNFWLFPILFQTGYWDWHLKNGKFIGFITAIMAMVIGDFLDKNTNLISANPADYLSACLHTVGLPLFAFGTLNRVNFKNPSRRSPGLDSLAGLLFSLVALIFMLAWLVVVTPVQYLVHLVFGAPIRFMLKSEFVTVYNYTEKGHLSVDYILKSSEVPAGWKALEAFKKPVSNTATVAGIFWFLLEIALK
jgi:hypothetical protein